MPAPRPPRHAPRFAEEAAARRVARSEGQRAEWIAALYLRLLGYRILARRYLVKGGEIDIVARRGRTIAFVEVKLRASLDNARISIAPAKQRRISRAARVFLSRRPSPGSSYRGDAVYCAPWRWPMHVPAAFELDLD